METLTATFFAGVIAAASGSLLAWKVLASLFTKAIKVTRADTGASILVEKPTAEQSRNQRSAQVHKLLDLVDAN